MSEEEQEQGSRPTVTVSISRKINLGNYESVDVFLSLSGVYEGMTEEEMLAALKVGNDAYNLVRQQLLHQVRALRQGSSN